MVRYTLFVLTVIASAATAVASIPSATSKYDLTKNVTVIEKNQFWSDLLPAEFSSCSKEDCSDTPQG
jgi:hypothetical protein